MWRSLLRARVPRLVVGSAAGSCLAMGVLRPRAPPLLARCDAAPDAEPYTPLVPPKLDDAAHNAEVMDLWRASIRQARELFAKLDYAGAEEMLKQALEQAGHFGQSSGPVATSLLNLAQLYRRAGRYDDAEPLLERAADVLDQTAGPHNKVTLLALVDLASNKLERGEATAARDAFADVLERIGFAQQTQHHAREPLTSVRAGCLISMAKADGVVGELSEAEGRLREALSLLEARWGEASPKLLAPCVELARALAAQGRHDEAQSFVRRAAGLPELRPKQRAELEKMMQGKALAL